jgi:hypothetical protein
MKSSLPESAYLDLKRAAAYTSYSVRSLRDYLKKPGAPPTYRISKKILIKRTDLDLWLERFKIDLDTVARRALEGLRL